jgi:hypothetical protein
MATQEQWKARALTAARKAKQGAIAAAKQADALFKVARQKTETIARRRKVRQVLKQTSRVMKAAGKAALVAGVMTAMAAVANEIRSGKAKKKRRA